MTMYCCMPGKWGLQRKPPPRARRRMHVPKKLAHAVGGLVRQTCCIVACQGSGLSSEMCNMQLLCATCNCRTVDFMSGLSIQQGRLDQMERKMEGLESDVKDVTEKIDNLDERVTKIEGDLHNNTNDDAGSSSMNQIIEEKLKEHESERRARLERRNNIVVFNLPEPDGGTPQERMHKDVETFTKMTKDGCKNEVKKNEIEKCFRLGKYESNKTRPLLIKLKDDERKKKLFLSLKTLREHKGKYENVQIGHDLTKSQREEHKEMINKAKEMDTVEGSENYIHLVRGPPDNLRIVKVTRKKQQ